MADDKYTPNENLFKTLYQKMLDEETRNVHNQLLDERAMATKLSNMCIEAAANDLKQNR